MERATWAEQVLEESTIGFLAMTDEADSPYVVPISFALRSDRILFHGGLGRKATALAVHPRAILAAVTSPELIRGDRLCSFNFRYRSVLASGPVELIEESDAREEALRAVVAKYDASAAKSAFASDTFARTLVYSLTVEELTTKEH